MCQKKNKTRGFCRKRQNHWGPGVPDLRRAGPGDLSGGRLKGGRNKKKNWLEGVGWGQNPGGFRFVGTGRARETLRSVVACRCDGPWGRARAISTGRRGHRRGLRVQFDLKKPRGGAGTSPQIGGRGQGGGPRGIWAGFFRFFFGGGGARVWETGAEIGRG